MAGYNNANYDIESYGAAPVAAASPKKSSNTCCIVLGVIGAIVGLCVIGGVVLAIILCCCCKDNVYSCVGTVCKDGNGNVVVGDKANKAKQDYNPSNKWGFHTFLAITGDESSVMDNTAGVIAGGEESFYDGDMAEADGGMYGSDFDQQHSDYDMAEADASPSSK